MHHEILLGVNQIEGFVSQYHYVCQSEDRNVGPVGVVLPHLQIKKPKVHIEVSPTHIKSALKTLQNGWVVAIYLVMSSLSSEYLLHFTFGNSS